MASHVTLLPRLSATAVDQLLELNATRSSGEAVAETLEDLPDSITFGSVGGSPVHPGDLRALKDSIEVIAREAGYPEVTSVAARARFDAACACHLAQSSLFRSGEAHRDDVWAFIAASLLRPITFWRFGNAPERHHGGVRNTFQRLWMRATVLDRGEGHSDRWGLVEGLSEDAFVAILERPAVASDQRLSLALAEGWLTAMALHGRPAMQSLMRSAIIRIRMRNEIFAIGALPTEALREVVDLAFRDAADAA